MRALTNMTIAIVLGLAATTATQAQTAAPAAPAPAAPAPAAPAPAAPTPATPAPAATTPPALTARPITPPARHRMTRAQRFEMANTTHDGHLTMAQAKAANMSMVVKNFDLIDTSKKGYVTLDDINTYYRTRHRTAVKAPKTP
jgi:pyruvate/2-oxoglutarate dehydrogenase complex dihydrolipoamide acyltransferase (E2) component